MNPKRCIPAAVALSCLCVAAATWAQRSPAADNSMMLLMSPSLGSSGAGGRTASTESSPGLNRPTPVVDRREPPPVDAIVHQELPTTLTLYVGQMALVKTGNVGRVAIGNGKVMEARVLDNANLLITAQDAGDTTLHVWDKSGNLRRVKVRVNVTDLDRIAGELRELTRGFSGVGVRRVGERVFIDGNNLDAGGVERLNAIAKLYAPAVVSLATADRIRVDRIVNIEVRIVEFSRTALDDLGVRWSSATDGFNFGIFSDIASSGNYRVLPDGSAFNDTIAGTSQLLGVNRRTPQGYFGIASTLGSRLNVLVQRGNAFVLASPNLSTRSGGEAKFLAGGEIPLPALSALGGGSVTFKPYGVRLDIKPIADGQGNISGSILTEVSSIDRTVAVQGIPGLLIRRTDTEFNVRDGETVVLSGLMNRESSRANDGLPGLRRTPLIGNAFRADTDSDKMQEVVVFITPRVVDPSFSEPQIRRAREIEDNVQRGFGSLIEDRSRPPGSEPVPIPQPDADTMGENP